MASRMHEEKNETPDQEARSHSKSFLRKAVAAKGKSGRGKKRGGKRKGGARR